MRAHQTSVLAHPFAGTSCRRSSFYAGLSVKKKKFFRNLGSIATLGILGTYILFAVIAFCLYAISMLPNLLSFAVRMSTMVLLLSVQSRLNLTIVADVC